MVVVPFLIPFPAPESAVTVDSMSFAVLTCTFLCCILVLALGARRTRTTPDAA